jgi:hypothetical protein
MTGLSAVGTFLPTLSACCTCPETNRHLSVKYNRKVAIFVFVFYEFFGQTSTNCDAIFAGCEVGLSESISMIDSP